MSQNRQVGQIAPLSAFRSAETEIADGAKRQINLDRIPAELVPLAEYVSRWGFSDSASRQSYADYCGTHDPDEVKQFVDAFSKSVQYVVPWLREIQETYDIMDYPPEADAFIAAKLAYLELAPPNYPDGYS